MSKKILLQCLNLLFSFIFFISSSVLFSQKENPSRSYLDESIYNSKIMKPSHFGKILARTNEDIVLHLGYDYEYMSGFGLMVGVLRTIASHSDKAFHIVKIPEEIIVRKNDKLVISDDAEKALLSIDVVFASNQLKKGKIVALISDEVLYELDKESLKQLQRYFSYIIPYRDDGIYNEMNNDDEDTFQPTKVKLSVSDISSDNDSNSDKVDDIDDEQDLSFHDVVFSLMDIALMNKKARTYLYLKEGSINELELSLDILSNSLYSNTLHYPLNVVLQMNYNPKFYEDDRFFLASTILASGIEQLNMIYGSVAKFKMTLIDEKSDTYVALTTFLKKDSTINELVVDANSTPYQERMSRFRQGKAHFNSMHTFSAGLFSMSIIRNDENQTLFVQIFYPEANEFAIFSNYVSPPSYIKEEEIPLFYIYVNNKAFPIFLNERNNFLVKGITGFSNTIDLKKLDYTETDPLVVFFAIPKDNNLLMLRSLDADIGNDLDIDSNMDIDPSADINPDKDKNLNSNPNIKKSLAMQKVLFLRVPLSNVSTDMVRYAKAMNSSYYIYSSLRHALTLRSNSLDKEKPIKGFYKFGDKLLVSKALLEANINLALATIENSIKDQVLLLNGENGGDELSDNIPEDLRTILQKMHNCYDLFNKKD